MDYKVNESGKITVTPDFPAHLVENFRSFLDYLMTHKINLTRRNAYFTKKDLLSLYSKMKGDMREVPNYSTQTDYPIVHLFYELSLVLDFIKVRRTQTTAAAMIQTDRIETFLELTAAEQYLSLLEAFWMEADWKELQGEKWGRAPLTVRLLFEELEGFPANEVIQLKHHPEINNDVREFGSFFYYFSYFGFWTVAIDEEKTNELTFAKFIELTPFFKKIQHVLSDTWEMYSDPREEQAFAQMGELFGLPSGMDEETEEEIEEPAESLTALLSPYFSEKELRTTLKKKQTVFQNGNYLFKVSEGSGCWITLILSSSHTLLDLNDAIQEHFDLFDDHFYAFYMDGKKFSKHFYHAPMDPAGPYVNEVQIGGLDLYEGQSFLYLYDFISEWEFRIQVQKITEEEEVEEPLLREKFIDDPE
ncbi:MAG: IS1096 element passenger TnpR family protein [Bacillota bacterium]